MYVVQVGNLIKNTEPLLQHTFSSISELEGWLLKVNLGWK